MTPQILFHSLLMKDKPRYMARNSDDFFPFDPSSHTWHIFTNAHNALLTQHLNILPDWDMFQTVHEYASMHAAARCLSGGSIYITDTPGKHDIKLINQMTAKSIAGRSIILRPDTLGTTTEMYVKPNSNRFLRIGTTSFSDSLLGVFNLGDRTRVELLKLDSFRGMRAKSSYVIRKHTNGHLFGPFDSYESSTAVPVQLHPKGYEILTAYRTFTCNNVNAAVLGLLGKMSGSAVRVSYRYHLVENDNVMHLEVGCKAVGMIGGWFSLVRNFYPTVTYIQQVSICPTLRYISRKMVSKLLFISLTKLDHSRSVRRPRRMFSSLTRKRHGRQCVERLGPRWKQVWSFRCSVLLTKHEKGMATISRHTLRNKCLLIHFYRFSIHCSCYRMTNPAPCVLRPVHILFILRIIDRLSSNLLCIRPSIVDNNLTNLAKTHSIFLIS